MPASAIQFDCDATVGIGEIDLGYEVSKFAVHPVLENGIVEPRIGQQLSHHPAPFAQRHGFSAEAVIQGRLEGRAPRPPTTSVGGEHAPEIRQPELPVPQYCVDRAVQPPARHHRRQVKDRAGPTGDGNPFSDRRLGQVELCGLVEANPPDLPAVARGN